jgi:hypothetical protein
VSVSRVALIQSILSHLFWIRVKCRAVRCYVVNGRSKLVGKLITKSFSKGFPCLKVST